MLRLPVLQVSTPSTLDEVVAMLRQPGSRIVAGGTDILPNLKHRLDAPPALVSLAAVAELQRVEIVDGVLRIGAGVTLTEASEDRDVQVHFPSVAEALGRVASPLIRNMGTVGGNINLDTRCRYVNQTDFWRSAIGGCLKSDGDVCHVVPKGRNCVAAMSSDGVPALISHDAVVSLLGPKGSREVALEDYFTADGIRHTLREDGEVTTHVDVPLPTAPRRSAYVKWTVRESIDFPLISVALRFDLEEDHALAPITSLKVVAGVLGAKPRVVKKLDELAGQPLASPAVADAIAEAVHKQCKPLDNVPYEAGYRREMLRVHTRRAVLAFASDG